MAYQVKDEIQHYGVKGMRRGVRKGRDYMKYSNESRPKFSRTSAAETVKNPSSWGNRNGKKWNKKTHKYEDAPATKAAKKNFKPKKMSITKSAKAAWKVGTSKGLSSKQKKTALKAIVKGVNWKKF